MMLSKINEECGVFGVFGPLITDVASTCYFGLFALQHRGQDSAGIVVNDDGIMTHYKETGLVNEVFPSGRLAALGQGNAAIGHVRYGLSGTNPRLSAQPIVINHVKGAMALAHNGSLNNAVELREELENEGTIFHSTSDAELISNIIIRERVASESIEKAIVRAMYRLEGAYSLLVMSPSKIIAVRDRNGFRPLCYGLTHDGRYVVASESCALDAVGAKLVRDIAPGEVVIFEREGVRSITEHCNTAKPSLCMFEYIYFARPDSVLDGVSVHMARIRAGAALAKEHPVEADVVIGVPDSGLDAAVGFSRESGIPSETGFVKNRYIARTFISLGQKSREDKVKIKLNPIASVVAGKRVVLIDDSIVRGTTSGPVLRLLREAGAREIHMRIASPPYINPCYYGTDAVSRDNLIACHHSVEEIAQIIGADSLGYLSLESAKNIAGPGRTHCLACFDGNYATKISERSTNKFELRIGENKQLGF